MAIAPSQSAAAGFTPRDVFVTQGAMVFKIHEGTVSLFATLTGCLTPDHNGITFDHFGTYGFDMIVTCQEGDVFRIHGDGTGGGAPIASTGVGQVEGPAVVPPGFGPHGGKIWVADEANNKVHAIGPPPTYTVTLNILSHVSAEGVFVTSEQGGLGADTSLVTFNGTNYVQSSFGPRVPGVNEGSSFVDCDVPTPTPTPTPTVTPTTCGSSFVIGDLDVVVGNHVTFWGGQWWKLNHLSGGSAPASFKGFANCTNPNPPACGGTWQSTPGNSSGAPESVPADITVIVSSLITKSGPIISGDVPMMVIVHTDPGYEPNPGHAGTGTVTAVVCP